MSTQKQDEQHVSTEIVKAKSGYWNLLLIATAVLLLTSLMILALPLNEAAGEITVYKSPACGCCSKWAEHLKDAGFRVKTIDLDNVNDIKLSTGVLPGLQSCHTAVVDGYVIEGHVPAADIKRLLQERPADVTGLAAPGMPMGSPGMESEIKKPYQVLAFSKEDGRTSVYASH